MSYQDTADDANSSDFQQRLVACASEQAQVFINDTRPEFTVLAKQIIADAGVALGMRWLVASAPVAGDLDDDPVLLSAVQHAWPIYGATRVTA